MTTHILSTVYQHDWEVHNAPMSQSFVARLSHTLPYTKSNYVFMTRKILPCLASFQLAYPSRVPSNHRSQSIKHRPLFGGNPIVFHSNSPLLSPTDALPFPSQIILGGFTGGQWGDISNIDGFKDIAAVKLQGSDGAELWRYQVVSSTSALLARGGFGVSYVSGVAVDTQDNPVLVGTTRNSLVEGVGEPGDWDFFAIKVRSWYGMVWYGTCCAGNTEMLPPAVRSPSR